MKHRWTVAERDWESTEGFRETLLVHLPPREAKTLRRLARMLFAYALEVCERGLPRQGSWTAGNLRAAARDLSHVTRFLRATAETAEEEVGLGLEERARLTAVAFRMAEEVGQLTADLEDALTKRRPPCKRA
jgi:hypothetical protein